MSSDITLYGSDGNPVIVTGDEMKTHGIESGSNANGSWTKFPDGTMIQRGFGYYDTAGGQVTVNYPISVASGSKDETIISLTSNGGTSSNPHALGLIVTERWENYFRMVIYMSTKDDTMQAGANIMWTAIGRWK